MMVLVSCGDGEDRRDPLSLLMDEDEKKLRTYLKGKDLHGLALVPELIKALEAEDPQLRSAVVATLSSYVKESKAARSALIRVLANPDPSFANAGWSLGFAEEQLLEHQKEMDPVVPVLNEWLQGTDRELRIRAAITIEKCGPLCKAAMPALLKALEDPRISRQDKYEWILGAIERNPDIPEAAIPIVTKFMNDASPHKRERAVAALGALGEMAVPYVNKALEDASSIVRTEAARALGRIGTSNPESISGLIGLLSRHKQDEAPYFQTDSAAEALARVGKGSERVIAALIETMETGDWPAQECAIKALGRMGPTAKNAKPVLEKLLDHTPVIESKDGINITVDGRSLHDPTYLKWFARQALQRIDLETSPTQPYSNPPTYQEPGMPAARF